MGGKRWDTSSLLARWSSDCISPLSVDKAEVVADLVKPTRLTKSDIGPAGTRPTIADGHLASGEPGCVVSTRARRARLDGFLRRCRRL